MTTDKEKIEEAIEEIITTHRYITYEDTQKIMVYDRITGLYRDATSNITRMCVEGCIGTNTPYAMKMIEMNIRGRTYKPRPNYSDAVALNNGILQFNKEEFKLLPHSPELIFETKTPIDYIPGEDCPLWKQTVINMLPDIKDRLLLQEWFGYHFMPGSLYEKAMFITGKPSTGKSTTISLLNNLLGNCCSHHQLSEFQDDKNYAIADLYGKLGNTYTDMSNTTITDVGKFKVLTGSMDTISSRAIYGKPFSFRNSAKLTFASNRLSPLNATVQGDNAFWKRVLLLQFSEVVKNKDDDIFNKLNKELTGILNWALEGYVRLIKNKGFTANTEDAYNQWTHSAYAENPLDNFINDSCMVGDSFIYDCGDLRSKYERYCAEHLDSPISLNEFRSALVQKGIFESTLKREHIYKGIAYKTC
jgi:putative DNA primase/helicase